MLAVACVVAVSGAIGSLVRGGNGGSGGAGVVEAAVFAGDVWFALLGDGLLFDGGRVGFLVGRVLDAVADRVVVCACVGEGGGVLDPVDGDGVGGAIGAAHLAEIARWMRNGLVEEGRGCF